MPSLNHRQPARLSALQNSALLREPIKKFRIDSLDFDRPIEADAHVKTEHHRSQLCAVDQYDTQLACLPRGRSNDAGDAAIIESRSSSSTPRSISADANSIRSVGVSRDSINAAGPGVLTAATPFVSRATNNRNCGNRNNISRVMWVGLDLSNCSPASVARTYAR